jgi:hypothetical protein
MRPVIPPPLDPDDFEIEVVEATDAPDGLGHTCATYRERSAIRADVVTMADPAWLSYAVCAALRGQVPRTRCFIVPTRTGGVAFDLGRGEQATPQTFGGAVCRPEPWGRQCDEADPSALPPHEALAPASRPRRRPIVEDAGDVVFEDWDGLRSPLFGGKAGAA